MRKIKQSKHIIFDSGDGGLNVVKEIRKQGLKGHFLYVNDSKNAPYGNLSNKKINKLTIRKLKEVEKEVEFKTIILACNTVSFLAKKQLEEIFGVNVYDIATFTIKLAKENYPASILSTAASHEIITKEFNQKSIPCNTFASYIETKNPEKLNISKDDLVYSELCKHSFEESNIILGCTHFLYFRQEIDKYFSGEKRILDPNESFVNYLKQKLIEDTHFTIEFHASAEMTQIAI